MAAKSNRYQLRSSLRATDDREYETPQMDDYNGLSQSDVLSDSQRFEQLLSDSFGCQFQSMQPMSASDVQFQLLDVKKNEPTLNMANYIPDLMPTNNVFERSENNWQPLAAQNGWHEEGMEGLGGFVFSQGHNMPYSFLVAVMPQSKQSNREYLLQNGLLFAKYNSQIPFSFFLSQPGAADHHTGIPMPPEMSIRLSLRYSEPLSDDKRVVTRCHVHSERDPNLTTNTFPFTLNHRDAVYDQSTHHVTIPSSMVTSLTFHCYSSCAGGIDRKPVFILFELLNQDGSVAQEAQMAVKVCANPSRDAPKEMERKRKEEEKCGRGRVKSEASSEMGSEKKAKKRKQDDLNEMGREIKRYESTSPMTTTTPSPGWNPTMTAPRNTSNRRPARLDFRSGSSDGLPMESTSSSRKTSEEEDDDDKIYTITIRGKKKYLEVMKHVQLLETSERYSKRNDEDNPYANLSQLTGDVGISTWLDQYSLSEENYVEKFKEMGVSSLYDVEAVYHACLFSNVIGIPRESAVKLNKAYINWFNLSKNLEM